MPFPILGAIGAAAGALARAGIIRGTAGKLLGSGAGKAVATTGGSAVTGVVSRLPGMGGAAPSTIGKIMRSGAGQVAVGSAVVAGASAVARRIRKDGKPYKRRTMNPTNPRALRRALSRVERFEKLVKRSFIVKDIKARKRSCR